MTTPVASPAEEGGWKLVPVEPTPNMMLAGADKLEAGGLGDADGFDAAEAYKAMLAAAPLSPDPIAQAVREAVEAERERATSVALAEACTRVRALFVEYGSYDRPSSEQVCAAIRARGQRSET